MPDRCAADARSSGATDCTARWHTFVLPKADTESRNWAIRMEYALPLISSVSAPRVLKKRRAHGELVLSDAAERFTLPSRAVWALD